MSNSSWLLPTFLTSLTMADRVANEEIFGPVLSVMTFRTREEAFERANNIPCGLSAGVWTDKLILKMVTKLRAVICFPRQPSPGLRPPSPAPAGAGQAASGRTPTTSSIRRASRVGNGYKKGGVGRKGDLQGFVPHCRVDYSADLNYFSHRQTYENKLPVVHQ